MSNRTILGIDPGTTVMGYGLIEIRNNKPVMLTMGVVHLHKFGDHYKKLHRIFERVLALIDQYHPTELAIEAPFFGKNVQSMLKLGRAQGAAISAALYREMPVVEYAPLKIKMSITGNGAATKEQVAYMIKQILSVPEELILKELDATDGLAAALCHFYQTNRPASEGKQYSNWSDFVKKNPDKVK